MFFLTSSADEAIMGIDDVILVTSSETSPESRGSRVNISDAS